MEQNTDSKKRILLVEDDESVRRSLCTLFKQKTDYVVSEAASVASALALLEDMHVHCIISDFRLPDASGIDLLRTVREKDSKTPFIIITGYGTISIAVQAMKEGANEFITKPFAPEQLLQTLTDVLQHRQGFQRNVPQEAPTLSFFAESPCMKQIMYFADRVSRVDTPVLISGESGTGKELLARKIHEQSPRKDHPFIALQCGSLPEEILESELFGHEAGAYTGATQKRVGLIEYAAKGTLFLDEIADMPHAVQVKLLRVLQEHEIRPLGSNVPIAANPRIIASTNQDIESLLDSGRVREDFYFRIAVMTLDIPPLRERPEDVQGLIKRILKQRAQVHNKTACTLSSDARALLENHPWPGNVRELQNVLERALILAKDTITPEHIGINPEDAVQMLQEAQQSLQEVARSASDAAERALIQQVLEQTGGNKSEAARILNVSYKTLLSRIQRYELDHDESREASL